MQLTPRSLFLAALLLLAPPLTAGTRYHVDGDAPPGGDGLHWATAFDSLDDALVGITVGDAIWLAEGTYTPTIERVPGDPRSVTFYFPAGVHLYGGFRGHETTLDDRAGLFDHTLLTGELGASGLQDNAYHVVTVEHPSGIPPGGNHISGLHVAHGNADGGMGGGVNAFNVGLGLADVTVRDNAARHGGGIFAQPGVLNLVRCVVRGNRASETGGALRAQAAKTRVVSSRFSNNVSADRGGAVFLHGMSPTFENVVFACCVFNDNVAEQGGAAFVGGGEVANGVAAFENCTFVGNRALSSGGAIQANTFPLNPAKVWLYNCILWGNQSPVGPELNGRAIARHSLVKGKGFDPQHGNLDQNPLFVDMAGRDLRLRPGSPCIDAGDNSLIYRDQFDLDGDGDQDESMPRDLAGGRRFVDDPNAPDTGVGSTPLIDIGAFERLGG